MAALVTSFVVTAVTFTDSAAGSGHKFPQHLAQQAQDVGGERLSNLDAEAPLGGTPQGNFGLPQQGARAHADGKHRPVEIEGASGVERVRCLRPHYLESNLAMADIDE